MKLAAILILAASIAACGRPDAVAENGESGATLPEPSNQTAPSPTGARPNNAVANQLRSGAAATIPAALQGRWGLSPADCTSQRGDAKGLLIVEPGELRFYESRAVPQAKVQTSANSISGEFAFTGEGQEWTRHQTLELRDNRLVRTERDPIGSFRYVRCD